MSRTDGKPAIEIVYGTVSFKKSDFYEYTREKIPEDLVRAAMMEELHDVSEKTFWAAADYSEMKSNADATFVRMHWVLCNKGAKGSRCASKIGRV